MSLIWFGSKQSMVKMVLRWFVHVTWKPTRKAHFWWWCSNIVGKWFFSFASGIVFFESSLSILLRMGEGHIYADVTVVVIQYICSLTSTQPPTFDHAIHVHFVQGCYLFLLICLADVNILGCICLPKINPQTFLFCLCRFLLKKYMCVLARWTLAQDLEEIKR